MRLQFLLNLQTIWVCIVIYLTMRIKAHSTHLILALQDGNRKTEELTKKITQMRMLTMVVRRIRTRYPSQSRMPHGKDQVEQHKYTLVMHPLVGFVVDTILYNIRRRMKMTLKVNENYHCV